MFNFLKKLSLANRILRAAKSLKELVNANKSDEVKEGFKLIQKGAEKIADAIPRYKELYLEILEVLKNA